MTNKNILRAFSALDADIVIGCEPSAAPNVNKKKRAPIVLRFAAVAACVALLIGGVVAGTLMLNRDADEPDEPSVPTAKKYEMYMNFSAGDGLDLNISENENVEFRPSSEKDFSLFLSKNKIDKPANVSDSIDVEIGGKLFSLDYDSAYETVLNNIQKFESFANNVVYKTNDDSITVELSALTKDLVFFSDWQTEDNVSGEFTAEEAKQAADKLLVELYGESFLNEYEYTKTNTTDDQRYKMYSVYYTRNVFGFDTDDYIFVRFNFKGELFLVNAYGKGMMEFAEEDLTKEEIEGAIAAVTETFSDTWLIGNSKLTLDSEGDYYLMTYLVHADGDKITEMRKVHTKIK